MDDLLDELNKHVRTKSRKRSVIINPIPITRSKDAPDDVGLSTSAPSTNGIPREAMGFVDEIELETSSLNNTSLSSLDSSFDTSSMTSTGGASAIDPFNLDLDSSLDTSVSFSDLSSLDTSHSYTQASAPSSPLTTIASYLASPTTNRRASGSIASLASRFEAIALSTTSSPATCLSPSTAVIVKSPPKCVDFDLENQGDSFVNVPTSTATGISSRRHRRSGSKDLSERSHRHRSSSRKRKEKKEKKEKKERRHRDGEEGEKIRRKKKSSSSRRATSSKHGSSASLSGHRLLREERRASNQRILQEIQDEMKKFGFLFEQLPKKKATSLAAVQAAQLLVLESPANSSGGVSTRRRRSNSLDSDILKYICTPRGERASESRANAKIRAGSKKSRSPQPLAPFVLPTSMATSAVSGYPASTSNAIDAEGVAESGSSEDVAISAADREAASGAQVRNEALKCKQSIAHLRSIYEIRNESSSPASKSSFATSRSSSVVCSPIQGIDAESDEDDAILRNVRNSRRSRSRPRSLSDARGIENLLQSPPTERRASSRRASTNNRRSSRRISLVQAIKKIARQDKDGDAESEGEEETPRNEVRGTATLGMDVSKYSQALQSMFQTGGTPLETLTTLVRDNFDEEKACLRDISLVAHFVLAYPHWEITADQLYAMFLSCYYFPPSIRYTLEYVRKLEGKGKSISDVLHFDRRRFLCFLKEWILNCYTSDFKDKVLGRNLTRFVKHLQHDGFAAESRELNRIVLGTFQQKSRDQIAATLRSNNKFASPMRPASSYDSMYGPQSPRGGSSTIMGGSMIGGFTGGGGGANMSMGLRSPMSRSKDDLSSLASSVVPKDLNSKPMTILHFTTAEIARQLTRIEFEMFGKIELSEINQMAFSSASSAPNVSRVINQVNRISYWVCSQVLTQSRSRDQVRVLAKFISIAYKCLKMKNFGSLMPLLMGLNLPLLTRLTVLWENLPSKSNAKLQRLNEFLPSNGGNLKPYRTLLQKHLEKLRGRNPHGIATVVPCSRDRSARDLGALGGASTYNGQTKSQTFSSFGSAHLGTGDQYHSASMRNLEALSLSMSGEEHPFIPSLPVYLKDLTFLNDGNSHWLTVPMNCNSVDIDAPGQPDLVETLASGKNKKVINFYKMQKWGEILREMRTLQMQNCSVPVDARLSNYLNNINPLAEDALWAISSHLKKRLGV